MTQNPLAAAPPDEETRKSQKAESDRLDRELVFAIENVLSITDVKAAVEKLERQDFLMQSLPAEEAWKKKMVPLVLRDMQSILKMPDGDQRKALDTIRSVRYALQDFRTGKKSEACRDLEAARRTFGELLGESSFYYLNCLDNELVLRLELQQGDKAISLAESLISQRTKMLGTNHPPTANAFEFAARAEMIRRNWVRAAAHAESANAIRHITRPC